MIGKSVIFALLGLLGLPLGSQSTKVDSKLTALSVPTNVVVSFLGDINAIHSHIRTGGETISSLKTQLEELQLSTQKEAISVISKAGLKYESFWINNRIHIKSATAEVVAALSAHPEVTEIREEFILQIDDIFPTSPIFESEWGMEKIEAQQAWELPGGGKGKGVVVSIIDTGVHWSHSALRYSIRRDYNWFDPYKGSTFPGDENGHGTYSMGIITGADGISPEAEWIACRGCFNNSCTETALNACGQFIVCPTLPNGKSYDCDKAPHLVSNSWSGSGGQTWFDPVIAAWHTAKIIPVFANGNSGPACGSVKYPANNNNVISVGSTTSTNGLSSFSSRGPAHDGHLKPDVSAPGSDIISSWHTNDLAYNIISGTGVAAAHVSGTIALLISINPKLSFEQIKNILQNNTDREVEETSMCGETSSTTWPNNMFGYGRINARKALAAAIA